MRRFFRTLKFMLSTDGAWVDGVEWNREDEGALTQFLSSDVGRRLSSRLRNSSLSLNAQAVQKGEPHLCGRASGYMMALADLQSLSASSSPQDEHNTEEDTYTGDVSLEHLTP